MGARTVHSHSSHWGVFEAEVEDGQVVAVHPYPYDADPSSILDNIPGSVRHPTRISQPMIRAGWLDRGPGGDTRRGAEPFVPVSWETVTELLANELRRVVEAHGPQAIYGGSYGWGSAGRFHHAQSQIHRFLNGLGGYTFSRHSYSMGAAEVIFPHVFGNYWDMLGRATAWPIIVEHADLFVCFGGLPLKNTEVKPGGVGRHRVREYLRRATERGVEFVLFSPLRDDLAEFTQAQWHPLVPGTDVAVMLALAHTLITERLHDTAFLDRYCVGFDRFERYVLGQDDGQAKTPEWAAQISQVSAEDIRDLARRMATHNTFITMSWSLQRTEFGEQAPWMGATLAAMLGQIGLPSGGFGFGYSSTAMVGAPPLRFKFPSLPQGKNAVNAFIPVARIADMLLHPGEAFDYDGQRSTYPDIRLVYWCGGNPFHHHQHLGRLRRAFARPETIVVHDPFWTAMARNADIVLPCAMTLERNDIGWNENDSTLVAMRQAIAPYGQARSDYAIFTDLASKLGFGDMFTEGRSEMEWMRHMYDTWRATAAEHGAEVPTFDAFWEEGYFEQDWSDDREVLFAAFRADPDRSPLRTPSGRIEIFSDTIHSFGYADCPGHPTWLEPVEWLGGERAEQFPLLLIANNPSTRLHSQLDVGATSQASKVGGREPIRLHPSDAAARGIADGDIVRVFNDRGSCLAGAVLSEDVRPRVAQLSTGAWYDPLDPADLDAMCVHGNPNAVTMDKGTSSLAQGCTGQHVLVEVERWNAPVPQIRVSAPPPIEPRESISTDRR
jgi:biotin/methionine sulfoxide reductase